MGAKAALKDDNVIPFTPPIEEEFLEEDCEACKL
jgi:hypothetical protein